MSRTASDIVPGWFIEFLSFIVKLIPRPGELTQEIAETWMDNADALSKALWMTLLNPKPWVERERRFQYHHKIQLTLRKGYEHASAIAFTKKWYKDHFVREIDSLVDFDKTFTDESNTDTVDQLRRCENYIVKFFQLTDYAYKELPRLVAVEEVISFMRETGALFVGAQGLAQVFDYGGFDFLDTGEFICSLASPDSNSDIPVYIRDDECERFVRLPHDNLSGGNAILMCVYAH